MERPIELEKVSLIQSTQQFSYNSQRKKHKWQKLQKQAIVNVYPQFKTSPSEVDENFEAYCWSELLLYKPFRHIPTDIGTSPDQIIANWKLLYMHGYIHWHIYGIEQEYMTENDADSDDNSFLHSHNEDQYEWEYLSQMGASNKININDLQMLGRRDYDINFDWTEPHPTNPLHLTIVTFISTNKINCQPSLLQPASSTTATFPLAAKQKLALDLILAHYASHQPIPPLHMIIQGTPNTSKSYLIRCIRNRLNLSANPEHNPLLVLAPTGVSAYNIQATTIHVALCIPLRDMQPLTGQSLMFFQEQCKQLQYILIDETSFLVPKLLLRIDNRLRQALPHRQHKPFGGVSIILVGDLGQLPPMMDKPLYASHSIALALWGSFQTVVTLDTSFRQQGASYIQQQFHAILQNIRNANALQTDWEALMSRSSAKLVVDHNKDFDSSIHLFATNASAKHHNTKMLKQLHFLVARCLAQVPRQKNIAYDNDEQLPSEILLSVNEQVMLIANLWIQAGW
ncbi:ATP-dependent DNA helicase pfh1-like [Cryptomeria japonica]|uniref:ATP-dependent DNA helicase pfh1-like n=1 Tax=Cryptomeria japonica TaxID=3369 RepID=UPI0027DA8923|nr:ATP-dependent DNA helicase pfh1-like [Cryptomeria japonica]